MRPPIFGCLHLSHERVSDPSLLCPCCYFTSEGGPAILILCPNYGKSVSHPPFKCHISTAHNVPSVVQMVRRHVDIWGDSLPALFPWEPNSEALANLTNIQWNPCSYAYFGCISMFVISPWKRFLTPTLQVCDLWLYPLLVCSVLCLEQGLRIWFSLERW